MAMSLLLALRGTILACGLLLLVVGMAEQHAAHAHPGGNTVAAETSHPAHDPADHDEHVGGTAGEDRAATAARWVLASVSVGCLALLVVPWNGGPLHAAAVESTVADAPPTVRSTDRRPPPQVPVGPPVTTGVRLVV